MFNHNYPESPQSLEALLAQSTIDASLFLPFTIYRMRTYATNHRATLSVSLYDGEGEAVHTHKLQLYWDAESDTLTTPPIQESTITEWAACGIALAIVPTYIPYRVLEVAQMGERFDYWLGHDVREVGLEISGTIVGNLVTRARTKQYQLQRNPYKAAGYVCIVGFEKQEVRLSFYQDKV